MKLAIICFTKSGYELMKSLEEKISLSLSSNDLQIASLHHKCRALKKESDVFYYDQSVEGWAKEQFENHYALLFIGAAGIAVRAIASSVKNKLSDSPVLVMDDLGQFVIPLLSGHVGGANVLAAQISRLTGAVPVITTATDTHKKFAIDIWAKENRLTIKNKSAIAAVSSKVLRGEELTEEDVFIGVVPPAEISGQTLWLQPKEYVLGLGCKKGKTEEEIREVLQKALDSLHIDLHQIYAIASIDVKKEEEGILAISEKEQIPFWTFSAEELNQVNGQFHESEFVKQQVGVGCVCERAAVLGAMQIVKASDNSLILPKQADNGITIAVVKYRFERDNLSDFPVYNE